MLLFGHRFIKSESFYHIIDIDAIKKTPPSSTIFLEFSEDNLDIIEYLNENAIDFALCVKDINELIYASALNAKYILTKKKLIKTAQAIAENYLFDAKILIMIDDEEDIEEMARLGIDGVIFSDAIIKINS
ncbi:hypothetical protein GJV85_01820 [Sulfurimonas aquatica]|uniref:Uncharacterized protein n=1 Tax=Sulfurimonas aquatica TaxID=2672570 RepID=A0A975AYH4_9BACT|nr:hypothetical protein [Sulfurimonas aquatica]QSZ40901.1 hypothetical protein GJV85_01820 [Sulfurimonas aquatica]